MSQPVACGATGAVVHKDGQLAIVEDAVLRERQIDALLRQAKRETAERCLAIAMETVSTPEGFRSRYASEIAHAIMRELLDWGGL